MYGDFHYKDKTVVRPFIFIMGIPILIRRHFYTETTRPERVFLSLLSNVWANERVCYICNIALICQDLVKIQKENKPWPGSRQTRIAVIDFIHVELRAMYNVCAYIWMLHMSNTVLNSKRYHMADWVYCCRLCLMFSWTI